MSARYAQRRGGNVGGEDARLSFQRQSDRNRARAGSDVHDNIVRFYALDGRFHQMLGFRTRDQDIRCYAKIAAVKLLPSRDVLRRLAFQPLVQIAAIVDPGDLGQLFFRVCIKITAVTLESVSEKHFGGEARSDDGFILQELSAL